MTKENLNKFNKKFIVTALGVAALGFQLMQTNNVKADTAADSKTGDAASEDTVETKDSSVADDSSIQKDSSSTTNTDDTDNADSDSKTNNDNEQQQVNDTDIIAKDSNTQSQDANNVNENNDQIQTASLSTTENVDKGSTDDQATNSDEQADSQQNTTENDASVTTDTQTNTDPAIIDGTPANSQPAVTNGDPIQSTIAVSATNSTGTMTSVSTATDGASALINSDATSANIIVTITNTSDEKQGDYGETVRLPKNVQEVEGSAHRTSNVVLSDDFDNTAFITGLPEGAEIVYSTSTQNNWQTAEELTADPNFKWSNVNAIEINSNIFHFNGTTAYLEPGKSIVMTIPITAKTTDQTKITGVSAVTTEYNRVNGDYRRKSSVYSFRYASVAGKASSILDGQYKAVLTNGDDVPTEIQNIIPNYKDGDATIDNFFGFDTVNIDKNLLANGGFIHLNLNNLGITKELNGLGYSYLLQDGTGFQQSTYTYQIGVKPVQLILRQVINAQNATTKIGQDWTAADNLTSVQDNNDNVLTGNDAISAVTTTINDQDGVLQDGKIVKAGTFEVTRWHSYY